MPTTIFTTTGNLDNSGDAGFTYRSVVPITGNAQGQIRVTFTASAALGGLKVDHCSIGISTGTNADTTATPVELLFSGVSGFNIAQGATITSDFANLSGFTSTDKLVVIIDLNSGGPDGVRRTQSLTGATFWFHAAATSFSSATTPAGSTSAATEADGFNLIEVLAVVAPTRSRGPTGIRRFWPGARGPRRSRVSEAVIVADEGAIASLEAVDDFEEIVTESAADDGAIQPVFADPPIGGPYSFYDILPLVTEGFANDAALLTPTGSDNEQIVVLEAVDDFEELIVEGFADHGAIQPVFADQAEIVSVEAQDDFEEIVTESAADDAAIAAVFADQTEIVVLDSDPGEIEFEAIDLALDGAIGPVFGDGPEIVPLDAEPVPDDEYDVGFFVDEAIGPVYGDGPEIVSLASEPEELEVESADLAQHRLIDDVQIASDAELLPTLDAVDDFAEVLTESATDDAALQPVFPGQVEIVSVSSEAEEDAFEALDFAQTGPVDDVTATDVPTGPLAIYDVLGQLSGTRVVVPDGAPQEVFDNEQIVALGAEENFFDEFEAADVAQIGPFDDAPVAGDVPTGPLGVFDLLDRVADSAHEPIVIAALVTVTPDNEQIVALDAEDTTEYLDGEDFVATGAIQPVFGSNDEIVALGAEDTTEYLDGEEFLDTGAIQPVFADQAEIVALDADPAPDDEYDVGFFLDEAIGAVFSDQAGILAAEAQDDFEDLLTDSLHEPGLVDPAITATDINEIVALDADPAPDDEYDVGFFLDEAIRPVFADQSEITNVEAVELDPDEPGLELVQDGTPDAVYADTTEIVSVAAEDDFEPEGGVDLVQDGAIAPVFADTVEIVGIPAEDDFEFDQGIDLAQSHLTEDVASDNEQILALEAQDDFESEFGLDLTQDGTPDAVYADTTEIGRTLDLGEADEEPGLDFAQDGAVQPVYGDGAEVVAIPAEDDFEPEIGVDLVQDGAIAPVYADTTEVVSVAAEDDFEFETGIDLVQEGTPNPVFADQAEIVSLEAVDNSVVEDDETLDLYRLVQALAIETDDPILVPPVLDEPELEDDPGLGVVETYTAFENPPPTFLGPEITILDAEDDFESEGGLELVLALPPDKAIVVAPPNTTEHIARVVVQTRIEANAPIDGTGAPVILHWQDENEVILPDVPKPFVYIEFQTERPGELTAFGGGPFANLYRNWSHIDAYVFVPNDRGLAEAENIAEQIADLFRDYRDQDISCFDATVIPGGKGESIKPTGITSNVTNYLWAMASVSLYFDQIG